MDAGYIVKYGRLVPGREEKAFDLFSETMTFWQEQLKRGAIAYFEPFLYASGDSETDLGFFLVKGPQERIREVLDTEEYRVLLTKGSYVVEHLSREWLMVAEEVLSQIERSAKVATEFAMTP
jgi:hypothetical protein